jgi:Tetratricopeptide repeat
MSSVRSAPDPAELERLHASGRFRDVLDRFEGLEPDGVRAAVPESLFLAASSAARLGQLEVAGLWADWSLQGFLDRDDEAGALKATNLMGAVDFECGRIARAKLRFGNALQLARRLGDQVMVGRTTNNLANIAHLHGQVERALRLYRSALSAYEAAGDCRGAAETLHNLALRFHQLGAIRDATHAADRAIQRAERCQRPALLALCLTGGAGIAIGRQDFAEAAAKLDWAEALARTADDLLLLLEVRRLRALILLETGQAERAAQAAAEVGRAADTQGSALVAAEAACLRALALCSLGQAEPAAAERTRALEALTRLGAADLVERFDLDWDDRAPPGTRVA